jgi:hypothetical protein
MLPWLGNTAQRRSAPAQGIVRTKKDPGRGRGFEVVFSVMKKST